MSTKLRITIVLPGRGLSGGVRVVATYGNKLIERGHQVTIVCLRHRLHWRPRPLLRRIYRDVCIGSGLQRDHLHDFKGLLLSSRAEDLSDRVPSGDVVVATHWLTADPVATLPEALERNITSSNTTKRIPSTRGELMLPGACQCARSLWPAGCAIWQRRSSVILQPSLYPTDSIRSSSMRLHVVYIAHIPSA